MADLHESSLLFSLDQLLAHERERVESERKAAETARIAAIEAEVAAERARIAEEARRVERERERQLEDERRFVEEQVRLEAIRSAELERVREETRLRFERDLVEQRELRERESRALEIAKRTKRERALIVAAGLLAALVVLSGAGFVMFGNRREAAEMVREQTIARETAARETAALQARVVEAQKKQRELEAELAAHTQTGAPSAVPSGASPHRPRPPAAARPPIRGVSRPTPCSGDAHDPLNPCLGG